MFRTRYFHIQVNLKELLLGSEPRHEQPPRAEAEGHIYNFYIGCLYEQQELGFNL